LTDLHFNGIVIDALYQEYESYSLYFITFCVTNF